jgi:hypothetical protein
MFSAVAPADSVTFFFPDFKNQFVFVMKENIPPCSVVENVIDFLHHFLLFLLIISFYFAPEIVIQPTDVFFPRSLRNGNFAVERFFAGFNQ